MAEFSTNNREEALDVVQDAMLAFVRRYADKSSDEWPPLFYRVLQNKLHDWCRRMQVRRRWRIWLHDEGHEAVEADPIQLLADPRGQLPEVAADNQAAVQNVLRLMRQLPQRQREAVLLRIWEGLDVAQTAQAMGCSSGSVKTHLSRGLSRLREGLEAEQ